MQVSDEAREAMDNALEALFPGGGKQDHAAAYAIIQSAIDAARADERAKARPEAARLMPMSEAPTDRTPILARTRDLSDEDRFSHYGNRWFVIMHIGPGDWALFPGFGVGDDWFVGWTDLPAILKLEKTDV